MERLTGIFLRPAIIGSVVIATLIIGLLANGNILMEGLPGLAKTRAIKTLSKNLQSDFSRIQFTPDLLPADVIGTMIYNVKQNDFTISFIYVMHFSIFKLSIF